jgi:putative transposase
MPVRKYKPEQIVTLLCQVEVGIANGKTTPQACREAETTSQTYYRWRKEFRGLKLDQAKRLKQLERENAKLNRHAEMRKASQLHDSPVPAKPW